MRYAQYAKKTKHLIFSSDMKDSGWENAEIADGDLKKIFEEIKSNPGKNIQIVGGAEFATSMIDLGFVDEYNIFLEPVIRNGKSFFHNITSKFKLTREKVESLDNGVVVLTYLKQNGK